MIPAVRLPDTEALVAAYLADQLTERYGEQYGEVEVATRVPNPRPTPFVRVFRTGGPARNRVLDEAQITVQTWAATTAQAAELITTCRDLLLNAAHRDAIALLRRTEDVSGTYYDPDPDATDARYTVTVRLAVRATTGA